MPNKYNEAQISLRDHFALQALGVSGRFNSTPESIAIDAYRIADAMLAERAKSTPVEQSSSLFLNAPDWAVCRATDESGISYFYEAVPTLGPFAWITKDRTKKIEAPGSYAGDWKKSLVMRGAK